MGIFGNHKGGTQPVFGPDGTPHLFVGAGNSAIDTSTGTMYTQAGNTILGTDGSINTVIGQNAVTGTNGTHLVMGPDNGPKFVL